MSRYSLLFICLGLSLLTQARSLELVFRYVNTKGCIVDGSRLQVWANGKAALKNYGEKADDWQSWEVNYQNKPLLLLFCGPEDTLSLEIDINNGFKDRCRTLVFPRLQHRFQEETLKINHLTCSWKATTATALEYRFINPLDGKKLQALEKSCGWESQEGLVLNVLSDSVMLLRCGENNAVFIKYWLGSDGVLRLEFSPSNCTEFNSGEEREFYEWLINKPIMEYELLHNRWRIGTEQCRYLFQISFD